jgi:2-haloacid dehalogenase
VAAVVFDLGNVLIEWDPRRIFSEEANVETDFFRWNIELDRGAPFADTVADIRAKFPQFAAELDRFRDDWPDILGPVDDAVVAIVDEVRATGADLFVLSNSCVETVPRSTVCRDVLAHFDGVLLSGEVGLLKPDHAIYHAAEQRFGLDPSATWFVDDSQANVDAAAAVGWHAIHFTDAATLRDVLSEAGLGRVGGRSS